MSKLIAKKGMFLDIHNDIYHADRSMVSKSWLDRVAKTPLHLRQYLDTPYEKTLALILGSAVDCLVFEPEQFDDLFVEGPDESKRTKIGKEIWAEAIEHAKETGRQIIEVHLETDYMDQCRKMATAIQTNPLMAKFLKNGHGQATFMAQDEDTGLWKKCKTDWYDPDTNTVIDLKTAVSASPFEFARSIANYRYHVQDSYYSDIIEQVTGEKPRFLFAVIEKPPKEIDPDPSMMAFYELNELEKEAGTDTYLSDLAAIAFALDTDVWTGYADEVLPICRPAWAVSRDK